MKVATWNLNHRARQKGIPPGVGAALAGLAADVVVLTEYVPGPARAPFLRSLAEIGLEHVLLSPPGTSGRAENHVLVASRFPLVQGDIRAPDIAPSVPSNALHVVLEGEGIEILGVRVPDYSREAPIRRACWDWLLEAAAALVNRPALVIGDLNVDPSYPKARCGDRLRSFGTSGWKSGTPTDGHSYWTADGKHARRLDHAFASPALRFGRCDYVTRVGDHVLAHGPGALSDHAALRVVVEHDAASRVVVLRAEVNGRNRRNVTAELRFGTLAISGQDLGPIVSNIWGSSEYEWDRSVDAEHFPRLLRSLGAGPDADLLSVIEATCGSGGALDLEQVIEDAGIPSGFSSRVGD